MPLNQVIPCWSERFGRLSLEAVSVPMGNDLCIVITGGELPHLGAVALAQVRPSLRDHSVLSASTSVLTLPGHKEDEIARKVAEVLATKLNKNVVVCCGIHIDDITAAEMDFVFSAIDRFCSTYPLR
jgi:gallate decarboxylase subunit D